MMAHVPAARRERLLLSLLHLTNRDFVGLARDFVALGFLPEGFGDKKEDMDAFELSLAQVFGGRATGAEFVTDVQANTLKNLNFGTLSAHFAALAVAFPFQVPADYALVIRSLAMLEGKS